MILYEYFSDQLKLTCFQELFDQTRIFPETNLQDYEYKVGDFMQIEDISKIAKLIQIKSKTKGLFQIGSSIIELPLIKVISVVENYNDKGVSSFKTDMDTSNYELDLRGFSVI